MQRAADLLTRFPDMPEALYVHGVSRVKWPDLRRCFPERRLIRLRNSARVACRCVDRRLGHDAVAREHAHLGHGAAHRRRLPALGRPRGRPGAASVVGDRQARHAFRCDPSLGSRNHPGHHRLQSGAVSSRCRTARAHRRRGNHQVQRGQRALAAAARARAGDPGARPGADRCGAVLRRAPANGQPGAAAARCAPPIRKLTSSTRCTPTSSRACARRRNRWRRCASYATKSLATSTWRICWRKSTPCMC